MNFLFLMALTQLSSPTILYGSSDLYLCKVKSLLEKNNITFNENYVYMEDLYDKDGVNKYCYYQIGNVGGIIYDKNDNCIVEYKENDAFPYLNIENTIDIYDENYGYYNYDLIYGNITNLNNFEKKYSEDSITESVDIYNTNSKVTWCNYYEYFAKLYENIPSNTSGTCTIVSISMLLGYYDSFLNDSIIDEKYDRISTIDFYYDYYKYFEDSPGVDDEYKNMVINESINELGIDPNNGLLNSSQKKVLENRLNHIGLDYKLNSITLNWFGTEVKKSVKNAINAGRPVILNSSNHSMIAYGYDNDYVYINEGYINKDSAQKRIKWSNLKNFSCGCFDIEFDCNSMISDNYYSNLKKKFLDPVSEKWYNEVESISSNFDCDDENINDKKSLTINLKGLKLNVTYLRCKFESSAIKLFSNGSSTNISYLQIDFDRPVYRVVTNLSFLNKNDKTFIKWASIETKAGNEDWITGIDLLKLNDSYSNEDSKSSVYVYSNEGFRSIKFYIEGTGITNDYGQLLISNIKYLF